MSERHPQNYHVLIVDDETIIRQVILEALKEEGYCVLEAESGERALELLQKEQFDVVITDITMGKVSGIDLMFKIKEIQPETEVILITGYASLETAQAAVAGKAYRYLRKPFNDIEDVIKIVEEAVGSRQEKKVQKETLQQLIIQRNRLEKKLGQLGTMYAISHAISFPESPASLLRDVAAILFQTLRLDLIACWIDETTSPELAGLFIVVLRPFQQETLEHLISDIASEAQRVSPSCQSGAQAQRVNTGKINIEKTYLSNEYPVKIGEVIEVTFPKLSIVDGILYIVLSEDRRLSEDETQLLEVTVAQIAGAIGKLTEFRRCERKRLQSLIEGIGDGVILFKQGGSVSMANQTAYQLLELERHADLEKKLLELELMAPLDEIQKGSWTLGKQVTLASSRRILSVTILPLESRWEAISIMVLHDITEHQQMQEKLEQSKRLSVIGELAAGVVHELNTPMSIILGYAQLMVDQALPEVVKGDIKNILGEANRCQKIIRNLLELAPSKNRQRSLFNAQDILDKVLDLKKHDLRRDKIKVICNYPEKNIWIEVDSGQIQQVLLNLIKNSQDAMENQPTKCLTFTLEHVQEKLQIILEDTGCGIAQSDIDRIFHPFFTTKPPGKGSGLGLSISHKILREHNGRIWCCNRPQTGAAFTIELPIAKAPK